MVPSHLKMVNFLMSLVELCIGARSIFFPTQSLPLYKDSEVVEKTMGSAPGDGTLLMSTMFGLVVCQMGLIKLALFNTVSEGQLVRKNVSIVVGLYALFSLVVLVPALQTNGIDPTSTIAYVGMQGLLFLAFGLGKSRKLKDKVAHKTN